jgi:hypothetical protein
MMNESPNVVFRKHWLAHVEMGLVKSSDEAAFYLGAQTAVVAVLQSPEQNFLKNRLLLLFEELIRRYKEIEREKIDGK